jgi:hypothetical protein
MRRSIALAAIAALVAGCGGTVAPSPTPVAVAPSPSSAGPEILPILVSSEFSAGPNRFLFTLTDRANQLIADPDVSVALSFYDSDVAPEVVAFETDSRFMWAVEGVSGLYVADVTFPSDGRWGTRFTATLPDGKVKTVRADYDVLATSHTPAIGAPAPSVETPTARTAAELAGVTTDTDPEPRFYTTSIADALEAGEPFVAVFATPAFCQTATCGPTLETVKAVAARYPAMTFINVEPYVMAMQGPSLQPVLDANGRLQPAPWTTAWDLLTEPFIAVVDGKGLVRAKFEGTIAAEELETAIDDL